METKLIYPNGETEYMRFCQLLRQRDFQIIHTIPMNNSRHRLIKTTKGDFYCLFRRADSSLGTFERFNDYFREFVSKYPQYAGHAESINKECLEKVIEKYTPEDNIQLAFLYQDGKIYLANPFLFKKYAENFNLIRTHKAGDIKLTFGIKNIIYETTYHMPFKDCFFENFEKRYPQ